VSHRPRAAFVLEVTLAAIGTALFVLSLLVPTWIEVAFGIDPDGGSGEAEILVSASFLLLAGLSAALAWRTRRRLNARPAGSAG
jgi:MYXO-CTERM domain-containing protein